MPTPVQLIVFWGSQISESFETNHSLIMDKRAAAPLLPCVLQHCRALTRCSCRPVSGVCCRSGLSSPPLIHDYYLYNQEYAAWKSAPILQLLAKLRDVRKTSCCFVALLLVPQKVRWCSLALKFGPVLGWVYLKFYSIKSRHFFARISI